MQSLFEWDFRGVPEADIDEVVFENMEEFAPGSQSAQFATELARNVIKNRETIDRIIEKAAPDWPIPQISVVDRNILRLGLYELLFADKKEVPAKVAINEAIELAKTFGGETSGKFVNGVLGTVYKEMGEPGKDEVSPKKRNQEPVDPATLPVEKKAGAVVYALEGDQLSFAFVHDIFGYWTLPKGGIEDGIDEKEGTIREIKEEIGIETEVELLLGENEYIASNPEKGKIRKRVVYYLVKAPGKPDLTLKVSGGLDEARWFPVSEITELQMYDDIIPFVTKAIKHITGKK